MRAEIDFLYSLEKFEEAVNELLFGLAPLRGRLMKAYEFIVRVNESEVPADLREEFRRLRAVADRRPPEPPYLGSIQTSLQKVRNSTLQEIARDIVRFRDVLAQRHGEQ